MDNFEKQFHLPLDEESQEKNKKIEKEDFLEKIRQMAQDRLEDGRINSFAMTLNGEFFNYRAKHEDLVKLVKEAFGGENPFGGDVEEDIVDRQNLEVQSELERIKKRDEAYLKEKAPEDIVISGAHAYEIIERKKEEEED